MGSGSSKAASPAAAAEAKTRNGKPRGRSLLRLPSYSCFRGFTPDCDASSSLPAPPPALQGDKRKRKTRLIAHRRNLAGRSVSPTLLYCLREASLRVVLQLPPPPLSFLLSGGDAGRQEDRLGGWLFLYIVGVVLGVGAAVMAFGFMPNRSVPSAQASGAGWLSEPAFFDMAAWCCGWRGRAASASSLNKLGSYGCRRAVVDLALLILLAGRGGEEKEQGDVDNCEPRGGSRSMMLQFGDISMAAAGCCHAHRPMRRPVQPPVRRPFCGASSAFRTPSSPSGVVPGGLESCRRWFSAGGGEERGPDCFSYFFLKVLCARFQDHVVIFSLSGSCLQSLVTAQI